MYTFINIHSKSKVVLETDKYLIHRRIKSKLSYADNYLEIKVLPQSVEDMQFYIEANKNFFRDKGVNFINLALPENLDLDKKIEKYLLKDKYEKTQLNLYVLDKEDAILSEKVPYKLGKLERNEYSKYLDFAYEIDKETGGEEWAEHNRESLYENIRDEDMVQIIAKNDSEEVIASVNLILNTDYMEIDSLYVAEKYRNQGIATSIISYIIKNYDKKFIILVADAESDVTDMYEKIGFRYISKQNYYLNTERKR